PTTGHFDLICLTEKHFGRVPKSVRTGVATITSSFDSRSATGCCHPLVARGYRRANWQGTTPGAECLGELKKLEMKPGPALERNVGTPVEPRCGPEHTQGPDDFKTIFHL